MQILNDPCTNRPEGNKTSRAMGRKTAWRLVHFFFFFMVRGKMWGGNERKKGKMHLKMLWVVLCLIFFLTLSQGKWF